MPNYTYDNIKIDGGVYRDENDVFQAFLDYPIDISYDTSTDNTYRQALNPGEKFELVKWVFKTDNQIIALTDGDYVNTAGEKIGTIKENTILLNSGFSINPLTLENIFVAGNTVTGEILITAIPGVENQSAQSFTFRTDIKSEVIINFKYPYDSSSNDPITQGLNEASKVITKPFFEVFI